ncbi:MAG TPA: tyrosine-type recombinase/integrase [Ktedonobacteraceae bacterium]|nr:tyrosine-type recombinase/integrase [Ktedonobacteraceae bacterium]
MSSPLHLVAVPQVDPVEEEFAKDIWDVRCIPGARYPAHMSQHLLNFTHIPAAFRPPTKRFIKFRLVQCAHSQCNTGLRYIRYFLAFYVTSHPTAVDLTQLTRADIEAYLLHLKGKCGTKNCVGQQITQRFVWEAITQLCQFLEYLERTSSPEAPLLPTGKLIWPGDRGKKQQQRDREIKYIPEQILLQLEQYMHLLPALYLPTVIILRASGWRIADVLNLRHDTCLEHSSSGWWLKGDIQKTEVFNHKVPISDEIAALVVAQCKYVKENIPEQDNPLRYLFPARTHLRTGRPFTADSVRNALNRLAHQCAIKDEAGHIFRFKNHAFRHTKAVELINAGMSLVHVQKWLAHLTPEMTLIYAHLLDTTVRKEWEQAFAKGAVRIDVQGRPQVVTAEQLGNEQEIEWEHIRHNLDAVRLADGYCFKPKKANCPTQDSPCYTCRHFCTAPDFLPQFEKQERELHELIELGERAGSEIWVERNTQKLNRVLPLIQVLRKGELHHPAGKVMREYTPEERAKRA